MFRWLIWWLTAPAQKSSRVRRNASFKTCNNKDDTTPPLPTLPSGPKFAWLLRRLAQTAEDFANFDNLVETEQFVTEPHENGFEDLFEDLLLLKRQQEKEGLLHDFHSNKWTDY